MLRIKKVYTWNPSLWKARTHQSIYDGDRWHGDARSQGISSHGIGEDLPISQLTCWLKITPPPPKKKKQKKKTILTIDGLAMQGARASVVVVLFPKCTCAALVSRWHSLSPYTVIHPHVSYLFTFLVSRSYFLTQMWPGYFSDSSYATYSLNPPGRKNWITKVITLSTALLGKIDLYLSW